MSNLEKVKGENNTQRWNPGEFGSKVKVQDKGLIHIEINGENNTCMDGNERSVEATGRGDPSRS